MGDPATFVAVTTGLGAVVTSLFFFHTWLKSAAEPFAVSPLACLWGLMVVTPHLSSTFSAVRKATIASLVGAVPACALASLGPDYRVVVTVCSFPLPFLYAMCDPKCSTPLQQVMVPTGAIISHYAILPFGPSDPREVWSSGLNLVFSCCLGGVSGFLVHLIVSLLMRRKESYCIFAVNASLSASLQQLLFTSEGTLAYFQTGKQHSQEVDKRVLKLRDCIATFDLSLNDWRAEWWSAKPADDVLMEFQSRLAAVSAVQTGLLETFEDGYSADYTHMIWQPLAVEIEELRLCGIAALRQICLWNSSGLEEREDGTPLGDEEREEVVAASIQQLHEASLAFQDALQRTRQSRLSDDEIHTMGLRRLGADEMVRAMAAVLTLKRFASAVEDLFSSLKKMDLPKLGTRFGTQGPCQLVYNAVKQVKLFCNAFCDSSKYFVPSPAEQLLESEGAGPEPICSRARKFLKYPFRLALTTHLVAIILMCLGWAFPQVETHGFWAWLPSVLCFLPTTGAGIRKSARRAIGTVAGSAVAISCVYWNSRDYQAFTLELFIVTFAGKFASMFPQIGYGGITFGITWDIVALSTWEKDLASSSEALYFALWRIGMTTAGVFMSLAFSLALFPTHATRQFERACAEALLCTTEVCVVTSRTLLSASPDCADQPSPQTPSARLSVIGNSDRPTRGSSRSTRTSNNTASQRQDPDPEMPLQTAKAALGGTVLATLEFAVRSGLPGRKALLEEAKAEKWLVARIFPDLKALQESSERLANLAAALWRNSAVFDSEYQQVCSRFFAAAPTKGVACKMSIIRILEQLRQSALTIALQLQGVRVPGGVASGRDLLEQALKALEHDFATARQEAWENGSMRGLISNGFDTACAVLFSLSAFAREWLELYAGIKAQLVIRHESGGWNLLEFQSASTAAAEESHAEDDESSVDHTTDRGNGGDDTDSSSALEEGHQHDKSTSFCI